MQEKEALEKRFIQDFSKKLYEKIEKNNYSKLVFLCVGTKKVTGDLVGPMVGSMLNDLFFYEKKYDIKIFGTLNENVNFTNVLSILSLIEDNYKDSCVIVIDAALSKKEYIGNIFVTNNKIALGSSFYKEKIMVGDIGIKVVVGKNYEISKLNYLCLNNVSNEFIYNISKIVSNGIMEAIKRI